MPTYEYRCPEGHDFENFVLKMSDAKAELPCPTCGAVAARRMSVGSGFLFKGSGFYITDYGKDGKKDQRAAAAKSEGAAAKADGSSKSDAAPGAAPSNAPSNAPGGSSGGASGGAPSSASSGAPSGPASVKPAPAATPTTSKSGSAK